MKSRIFCGCPTAADRVARIVRALDLFESIKSGEGIEAMLAAQMVGTHHAAMECLRRAMLPSQFSRGAMPILPGHSGW